MKKEIKGESYFDGNFYEVYNDGTLYTIGNYYCRRLGNNMYEIHDVPGKTYVAIPVGERMADGNILTQEIYEQLKERAKTTRTFLLV